MTIIPLRAYNREIEGMIDNGQLDEAVAHCRHILTTFPKHIATYRLMGKAHLEQQRISDATDIFQRVLTSVPDDFIANVGMSIIREDENNLDSSIWHMELAFEAQPANAAIQDELRRLYGRRDGVQPSKVRLTRGALARMYAKGGLYEQAIAELRNAIAEDPNRPDLQLLLAEMHFQNSQRIEAVDLCANIIKKIPFCLEANRILAVSLPEAEQSEAVRNYRQIVISMDPYYAFASPESLTSDQVPENAVNIERLDWKSGIQVAEPPVQPNWATSLGISIEKTVDDNIPDWMKSTEGPAPTPPSEESTSGVSPFIWDTQEVKNIIADTSKPEAEIPDWMKDAGWELSSGAPEKPPEVEKPAEPSVEPELSGELEKAEIPEWLQGIAPEGALDQEKPPEKPGQGELSTPWLDQHQPGPTDSIVHWLEDNKPEKPRSRPVKEEAPLNLSDEEIPDWLKDLEPSQPQPAPSGQTAAVTPAFTIEPNAFIEDMSAQDTTEAKKTPIEPPSKEAPPAFHPAPEDELPGFPVPAEPAAASSDEIPDWLKELAGEQPTAEEVSQPAETVAVEASENVIPPAAVEAPAGVSETPVTELPAAEEIPAIESPAFVEPLPSAEVPVAIEERPVVEEQAVTEELPAEAVPSITEEVSAVEASITPTEGTPEEETPIVETLPGIAVPTAPLPAAEETPVVEALPPVEEAQVETPLIAEQPLTAEIPSAEEIVSPVEISADAEQAPVSEQPAPVEEQLPSEQLPAEAVQAPVSGPAPVEEELPQAEAFPPAEPVKPAGPEVPAEPESSAWLEGLAAEQIAKAEALPAPTEGGDIVPPEWVKLEAEPPSDETVELESKATQVAPTPAEKVPEWIKGLGEEPEIETKPEEAALAEAAEVELPPSEELPAWLRELEEPEPEKGAAEPSAEGLVWKPEEMPDWLKEITETEAPAEATPPSLAPTGAEAPASLEAPTSVETPTLEEAPVTIEAVPAEAVPPAITEPASQWTAETTPPAGIKKEAIEEPKVEAVPAVPAVEELAQPTAPIEAPAAPVAVSEEISLPPEIPTVPQEVSLEQFQAVSTANQTALGNARGYISQRKPRQAVETYSSLIKQNYHLEEIIKDLQDALYSFPVDIEMWVTLGDAFFRSDNLEEALSAYTKAEELVR